MSVLLKDPFTQLSPFRHFEQQCNQLYAATILELGLLSDGPSHVQAFTIKD